MAQTFNTQLKSIASNYAKLLRVKVTASTVKKDIEEHSYYPSLLSLSETFNKYKVPNLALRTEVDEFDRLPVPFVAYTLVEGGDKDFVLVTDVTGDEVRFLYKAARPESVKKEQFLRDFQNIVWAAEPDAESGEKEFVRYQKAERVAKTRKGLLFAGLLSIVVFFWVGNIPGEMGLSFGILSLLQLGGLIFSGFLLMFELDKENAFVKNICSIGRHTNCSAVLGSKAAKLSSVSWSEIGFFYFGATTIWLLQPGIAANTKFTAIAFAGILASCFIPYSIYYQWRTARQWCMLCLAIQAILFMELIWGVSQIWLYPTLPDFGLSILPTFFISSLAPVVIWYTLKPIFRRSHDYGLYKSAYKRIQYNPDLFNALLEQQPEIGDGWQGMGIALGATDPEHVIVKICNPYCGPCSKAHAKLAALLEENQNVQVRILFLSKYSEQDELSKAALHLLAIGTMGDRQKTKIAMDDWYLAEQKDYEDFAAKYPMSEELMASCVAVMSDMSDWCYNAGVRFTPTYFLDGHRMPDNYDMDDLSIVLMNMRTAVD